jgi:hypothetical protein
MGESTQCANRTGSSGPPRGWCVEPLVVGRHGRVAQRIRVTRMGVFVGEVTSPQQLAKLGVPVAELVEKD